MIGPLRETSPRRIGPYETLARLGAGGMGEVFLGAPAGDGPLVAAGETGGYVPEALVAVKAIRRDVADEAAFRARFRREIAVATAVDSPYVARLVGGDADADVPWMATEYVPGPTLSEAVRRHGALDGPAVAALGIGIARALEAVHAAGALHRDLKPGNVLVAASGPKLIDFGVARTLNATTLTSTGLLVGTPGFMSPEHIAGGRHVVPASDVFCLASVLAYAAAGEDPFGDGPVAAVLYRVSQAEARLDGVPEELREVLAPCLVREAGRRPGAGELAGRLAELYGGPADLVPAALPEAVTEAIGQARRDVEQLCAAGRPLLPVPERPETAPGPTPTPTPTAPGSVTVGPAGSGRIPGQIPGRTPTALGAPATAPGSAPTPGSEPATAPGSAPTPGSEPATAPGSAPGVGADPHSLPTLSGAAPGTAAPVAGAPRPRRRRALAAVVAVAVVGGVTGALLALLGPGDGDGDGDGDSGGGTGGGGRAAGPAPTTTLTPAQLVARAGVDEQGTDDHSGYVPQFAQQRPEGWKPWRAKFRHAPLSCATDARAVVCQLTDGTYEALGAADGRRLWASDGRSAADRGLGEAYMSPSGQFFMPGDDLNPVVRGGTTVIAYRGRLQVRDSTTGRVRWTAEPPAGTHFTSARITEDRILAATEGDPEGAEPSTGATLLAYDARRGGDPQWTHPLSTDAISDSEKNGYGAEFDRDGLVYALAKKGLVALDARTGEQRGAAFNDRGAECIDVMADADHLLCVQVLSGDSEFDESNAEPQTRVTRLDARTLKPEGRRLEFKTPPSKEGYAASQVMISAVGPDAVLADDTEAGKILVAEPEQARVGRRVQPSKFGSSPLITGDRALYADNSTLRSLPLKGTGAVRSTPVAGAPGDRPGKSASDGDTVIADSLRPPKLLLLGGVATIVYDQGTVVSVRQPS
ncbi:protein kinase domain-containing protein [Actinomycetota bacterium Odt1-20B]